MIRQITLNSILDNHGQRFQFLKLDVQGAELDVLAGATRFLHRVEAVLMEVATLPYNKGAPTIKSVIRRMDDLGFSLFDILDEIRLPSGCLFQFDALFVRADAGFRPRPPYIW